MNRYEIKIIEAARKIDSLEKEFLTLKDESKRLSNKNELKEYTKRLWLIGSEAFDIRNEIIAEYPNITNLQINDPSVKKILEKIRSNDTFDSISFFQKWSEALEEETGERFDFPINFEQYLEAKFDDWYDEFHQRFHLISYYQSIIEIGPIISSSKIPPEAQSYFDEIREAYAVRLDASAVALCRAVMEMCLFDKLKKKGFFKNKKVVPLDIVRQDNLSYLIRTAKNEKLLDKATKELADQIRISANQILHPKKTNGQLVSATMGTFQLITDTVKVIEKLYS